MPRMMNDGKPLHWHLYPPFPWNGPNRKRMFSYLYAPTVSKPGRLLDETCEEFEIEQTIHVYDQLKSLATGGRRTIYTNKLNIGSGKYSVLMRAANDKQAEIMYHPKGGIRGIKWKHVSSKQRAGALLTDQVWYREEPDIVMWLDTLRRTSNILGCGDYDTAGSLGQATLSRYWTERGLRRIWRLPEDMTDMIQKYSVGGRAEVRAAGDIIYPNAWEIDLSSAYPTAVARGIPAGDIQYHSRSGKWFDREAVFGLWRISVHEDIPFSPIPVRDWESTGGPIGWSLDKGWEFEYSGWEDEINALIATGRASAEFVYGWSWLKLDSFLAPWVDNLKEMRDHQVEVGEQDIAKHIKRVMNAAIGRWGMSNEQWQVIPDRESSIDLGDLPMEFGQGSADDEYGGELTGLWVRPIADQARHTMPYHWSSYVKMAVRMELWRKAMEEMSYGGNILSMNFDSILMSDRPQGSNSEEVYVSQAEHPWVWKEVNVGEAQVPYSRAFIFRNEGEIKATLPGAHGDVRKRMVLDFIEKANSA